jgi:hypothetical protein
MRTMVCAAALIFTQSGAPSFAGTWTADLAGQQYARLQLTVTGTDIRGNITLGNVHFGREGTVDAVMRVTQDATVTPIFDVALRDGVLSFARKDQVDIDRFEMRTVNGEARLTILLRSEDRAELASQGVAALQPIPLKRTAQ